jgi:RNA polymerase subunit RPABC4/transcription elongation factor Spt4
MSRFSEELKVIPNGARIVAGVVYAGWIVLFTLLFMYSHDQGMQSMPAIGKFFVVFGAGLVLAVYILLIGYVNGDAKRRGMRYGMWTLLAIFIPNAIGIILYFVLRDPPLRPCPQCAAIVRPGFTFCPQCGISLLPTCPNCGKSVELGWSNCPQCGTKLPGAGVTGTTSVSNRPL